MSSHLSDMLTLSNLHRHFGAHCVLQGVGFSVAPGEVCGLIGPSGGGKSTLLKIIAGIQTADQGELRCEIDAESGIELMFQEGALFDSLTVFENVAFPLAQGRLPLYFLPRRRREEIRDCVSDILARVGLTQAAQKYPGEISGGMRRRASLARALVSRPRLALLDDPTAGLDPVASGVIMELIMEMHAQYSPAMIMVSHDLRRLLPVVGRVLALFDGAIAYDGPLECLPGSDHTLVSQFISCRYDLVAANY